MSRPGRLAVLCALVCALSTSLPALGAGNRTVLHYGDSLALGTEIYLDGFLPGWRVRASTEISRHASDVPAALRELGPSLPRVIVVSAGTNDDPGAVSRFAGVVRETVAIAGRSRCVVWSTIVRPPYQGVSYAGYNRALRTVATPSPESPGVRLGRDGTVASGLVRPRRRPPHRHGLPSACGCDRAPRAALRHLAKR